MEEKRKNDDISGQLKEVRVLIAEDMDAEAVLRLRNILRANPENIEALLLYAQVSPSKGKAKDAIKRIFALDPDNAEARLLQKRIEREEEMAKSVGQGGGAAAPTINIVNTNENTNTASAQATAVAGSTMVAEGGSNRLAFWVGFIAALFGLYGIGYMINGKVLMGLLYLFILGPIFLAIIIAFLATPITALLCTIPLYFVGAWQHAKAGAKKDPKLIPVAFVRS